MRRRSNPGARNRQTVLLLGNYRPALTLSRVLSKRGYRIISGLQGCDGGAEHSRFVDKVWDHPAIETAPQQFLVELGEFIRVNDVSIVFPVSENFVMYFARHPGADACGAKVAMVNQKLVGQCLDKIYMMELARTNNVPTAAFAIARNQNQLVQTTRTIGFPLVIRPEESTTRLDEKKALFVADEADFERQLPVWPNDQDGLIVQKMAGGKRHNIYFASEKGQLFRYLHAIISRTDSPDGSGLAVDGITIEPTEELRRYSESLIRALNYTGIGCVQFLVDEKIGKVSFLEINARIAGNHALPEFAGLGLSTILLDLAVGRPLDTTPITGKSGIRFVWTSGDILAAKIAWSESQAGTGEVVKRVLQAVGAALRADIHMTFSLADPMPGLIALKNVVPNGRKLVQRLGRFCLRVLATRSTQSTRRKLS
jgi:biotin carboxylase